MTEDGDEASEVITPKRPGLGRRVLEKNTFQRSSRLSGSFDHLPFRVGQDQDRPSYGEEYLKELRDSTPSTPRNINSLQSERDESDKVVDVAAKFGEIEKTSTPTVIPSEAEIREKKERRARLAREQEYISLNGSDAEDYVPLGGKKVNNTRLVRDDEDFAEGFDEYVEDGGLSLGRKAELERQRRQREEMRELIEEAENTSEEDESDVERKAAYEAAQTRAAIGGDRGDLSRPRTPPKVTSLPHLAYVLERLRASLAEMENSKKLLVNRMEELRKEKADIAAREVEIQTLIKEAGEKYEKLRIEAGLAPGESGLPGDATPNDRGLESLGTSVPVSRADSDAE